MEINLTKEQVEEELLYRGFAWIRDEKGNVQHTIYLKDWEAKMEE